MPDTIDHIEIVSGTLPKRNGNIVDNNDPVKKKIMYVETSNKKDTNEWYAEYDLDMLCDLSRAMLEGKIVKFDPDAQYQPKPRRIVNRDKPAESRPASFMPFKSFTIT